jgi:2,4-dienoyl-CoA reductase (NADPH2)
MLKRSHTPFGHTLGRSTGWVHRAELARNGVKMLKGVEYKQIDAAGLHITLEGAEVVDTRRHDRDLRGPGAAARTRDCAGGAGAHAASHRRRPRGRELDAKRAMLEGAELAARL